VRLCAYTDHAYVLNHQLQPSSPLRKRFLHILEMTAANFSNTKKVLSHLSVERLSLASVELATTELKAQRSTTELQGHTTQDNTNLVLDRQCMALVQFIFYTISSFIRKNRFVDIQGS
jgi:hypothetical protein